MRKIFRVVGVFIVGVFFVLTFYWLDISVLYTRIVGLLQHPFWIFVMFLLYGMAFFLRAVAWKWYLCKEVPVLRYLDALWYSLLINHLLPFKVGDAVRVGLIAREDTVTWDEAIHSVVVMRLLDLSILITFASTGMMFVFQTITFHRSIWIGLAAIVLSISLLQILKRKYTVFIEKHLLMIKQALAGKRGILIILTVLLSWVLEGVVVFGVSQLFVPALTVPEAVWANSLTVGGQVFQITPGGLATYESLMSFALVGLQFSWQEAYNVALISHAFKFLFSFLVGGYVLLKSPLEWKQVQKWIAKKGE